MDVFLLPGYCLPMWNKAPFRGEMFLITGTVHASNFYDQEWCLKYRYYNNDNFIIIHVN